MKNEIEILKSCSHMTENDAKAHLRAGTDIIKLDDCLDIVDEIYPDAEEEDKGAFIDFIKSGINGSTLAGGEIEITEYNGVKYLVMFCL